MPNHIESFIGWKIMEVVYRRLCEIQRARGYNTDPLVSMDWPEVQNTDKSFSLFLECIGHHAVEHAVGGNLGPRVTMALELMICGYVQYDTGVPRKMAMSLEQDAREAVHAIATQFNTLIGRGVSFAWGDCTHDGGALSPEKEANFTLLCTFTYQQSAGW